MRYFLLGLGGSNLERASRNSAASILTGVENSSMEVSPSQGIFVQYVDLSQERKEDARLPRELGGIGVRAKMSECIDRPAVRWIAVILAARPQPWAEAPFERRSWSNLSIL